MADDKVINGLASDGVDDQTADDFYDTNQREIDVKGSELNQKIEALERKKIELAKENSEMEDKVKKLMVEIQGLKHDEAEMKERLREMEEEVERSQDAKKASEVIAARAAELETELSRLQHDLISTRSEAEESRAEVVELKRVLGEKGTKVENLKREVEELKQAKAENEKKLRDLERKAGILEAREIEEKSKKIRVEEEMRERIDEKEKEISGFKKKVDEFNTVISNNRTALEKWVHENVKLEEALGKSEEKTRTMESKVVQLQEQVVEAEKVITALKETAVEAVNGTVNNITRSIDGEEKGLKLQWPVVAAGSTGAIVAAAAVIYVCYGRSR
ncbi:peroxisomal and mitochondrial division factor 2-like [Quillaja saponaria]|uniref:Peroxisomal and mitochondrial division factor 2-like n=1 Tax=Quillaja saponaria TaxID=32244 RepID=A0AAD7LM49_QUISA|nr:peroxisomal and mitochondrial division factor 2-like [Quillaja saponaria]KAJ7960682.1 peroxisomal and mitochondrial division factor 2-like [Quillaja saponaria]